MVYIEVAELGVAENVNVPLCMNPLGLNDGVDPDVTETEKELV